MTMEPPPTAIIPCPICRQKLRQTADFCPSCGAERHFGPSVAQSVRYTIIGLVAVPAIAAILAPGTIALICMAVAGAAGGFYVAHSKFGTDRWVPAKKD